jgi:hypothetical protein
MLPHSISRLFICVVALCAAIVAASPAAAADGPCKPKPLSGGADAKADFIYGTGEKAPSIIANTLSLHGRTPSRRL